MSFVYRLAFAVIYLTGCIYFAVATLGGGHGTLLFLVPLVTVLGFVVAMLLLGRATTSRMRVSVASLVIFHYLFTLVTAYLVESGDHFAHTLTVFKYAPSAIVVPAIWYILGNIIFWALFFRSRPETRSLF